MSPAFDLIQFKEEILDGKVYYMSPSASPRHGEILLNIAILFKNYLKGKKCKVFTDTIDIYLDDSGHNRVIPDVSILCDETKFTKRGYEGIPSLVVEVLSPTSINRDRKEKFHTYEKYGIKEYWIIDPLYNAVEQFVLENGKYELMETYIQLESCDRERLTAKELESLKSEITTSLFHDLNIKIEDIFGD